MEPAGSLPHAKDLIAGSYPELHESSPRLPVFKIISLLLQFLSFSDYSKKILYALFIAVIQVSCPAYLIPFYLITAIIFGEDYRR
jgi:hypothetical protein